MRPGNDFTTEQSCAFAFEKDMSVWLYIVYSAATVLQDSGGGIVGFYDLKVRDA